MQATYHIRIKKEYAASVIEDLEKMKAVELVPETEAFEVPQWQKEEVRKRIAEHKKNPQLYIDEDTFFAMLNKE